MIKLKELSRLGTWPCTCVRIIHFLVFWTTPLNKYEYKYECEDPFFKQLEFTCFRIIIMVQSFARLCVNATEGPWSVSWKVETFIQQLIISTLSVKPPILKVCLFIAAFKYFYGFTRNLRSAWNTTTFLSLGRPPYQVLMILKASRHAQPLNFN